MKNKCLVEELDDCNLEFDFCELCIYRKQHRVSFYSSSHKSSRVWGYVHSHVFGPINLPSLNRFVYFVSFIDECSRRAFVYFLKSKSEVFNMFKEFKFLVENKIGRKIKCLRKDNSGEFCSTKFDRFYKEHKIERHKITPYTQPNGVEERMNIFLMERARSMLSGGGLEQNFWAKVVATTCYLINRSPTLTLVEKTLVEAWSSKKPSIRHLRVFGYEAYAHVRNERDLHWRTR